jgi:hypothetical protein
VPLFLWLLSCVQVLLLHGWWPAPPWYLQSFSKAQWKIQLLTLWPPLQLFVQGLHKMSSCSSDGSPISGLGPLCNCCI